MKRLKNAEKTICGIKYPLFTIISNEKTGMYCYYVNCLFSKNVGDRIIYRNKLRVKILNKYTLSLLGGLFNVLYFLTIPVMYAAIIPILLYFQGCVNFVKDDLWSDGVRLFSWVNIGIIILLSILLVLK